ncbi:MAG: TIR domain-containing protein [Prevotellaceae bacterium]|jgi:hypothetical protein|nr:TIR domain-containing protein [Prevotellaceae bacterium]
MCFFHYNIKVKIFPNSRCGACPATRVFFYLKLHLLIESAEASADEPINSENAYYIKQWLKQKIEKSNIVLGIAGMYASYSDWMEWELDKAIELGIPIVGVIPRGQERISITVSSRSKEDVRWNTESIVEAIRKWAK